MSTVTSCVNALSRYRVPFSGRVSTVKEAISLSTSLPLRLNSKYPASLSTSRGDTETVGASLTASTFTVLVIGADSFSPSLTLNSISLSVKSGISELFEYLTDSNASSYCSFVAVPLRVRTPSSKLPLIPFWSINTRESSPST